MKHAITLPPNSHTPEEAGYFGRQAWDPSSANISTEPAPPKDLESYRGKLVYIVQNVNTTEPNLDLEPGVLIGIGDGLKPHCLVEFPCSDINTHKHMETCRTWVDKELVRPGGSIMEGVVGDAILRTGGTGAENHLPVRLVALSTIGLSLLRSPKSNTFAWFWTPKPTLQLDGSLSFTNRPLDISQRIQRIAASKKTTTNVFMPEHEETADLEYLLGRESRNPRYRQPHSVEDFILPCQITLDDVTGIRLRVPTFTGISNNPDVERIKGFLAGAALASG
jgi:hypothetical protein